MEVVTSPEGVDNVQHQITRLLSEKTGEVVAFACRECRTIVASNATHSSLEEAEKYANTHANPPPCRECGTPRKFAYGYQNPCSVCSHRRFEEQQQKREEELFEKADKVRMSDWKGHCLTDGDERFFFDLDEALDHYDSRGVARPKYLWDCDPDPMTMAADGILEHALSEHHEDAIDRIPQSEIDRLQKYLDRWCKKQKVESWYMNNKTAVLLDPA